ncbi:MAG: phosphoesterase, partial [Chlorobaculum sp.]|nr:phosphoesterase [Chlorobaculum sp.]
MKMTDYHCHILPGIDDGASTLDESIQMARLLAEAGFNSVHCTPHLIKHLYDASNAAVQRSIKELQAALDRKGIALKLLAGREYCMDNHFHEYLDDLMPLEGTRYLLIEIPSGSYQGMILETITAIRRKGLIPMIAHPERCRLLDEHQHHKIPKSLGFFRRNTIRGRIELEYSYQQIGLLDWLSGIECCFQGNVGSF